MGHFLVTSIRIIVRYAIPQRFDNHSRDRKRAVREILSFYIFICTFECVSLFSQYHLYINRSNRSIGFCNPN